MLQALNPQLKHMLLVLMCAFGFSVVQAQNWKELSQQSKAMMDDIIEEALENRPDVLIGRAVLPAATFSEGPTSGNFIGEGPINGQEVPFIDKQPVQGFSSVLNIGDGTFWAMSDNGFGGFTNSADYNLRIYRIRPDFESIFGGEGTIEVLEFIELTDPNGLIPFATVNHFTEDRVLTGADFDIESIQITADGSIWIGDEFGPFLLHFDSTGVLMDPPYVLPDFDNEGENIRAPQHPFNEEGTTLRIMNAVNTHAKINGSMKTPVCSPWFVMLADGNPNTFVTGRQDSIAQSIGLVPASSEIHNVRELQSAGYPVVPYTINDSVNMVALMELGVDGIISDSPDLLYRIASTFDGDEDGIPDFVDEEGLLDITKLDAQGHRGARNLRPENTIPSFEAALDFLMTTLELDCAVTSDGIAILSHDPHIESARARRADGMPYEFEDEVLFKDFTLAEIQSTFIADVTTASRPNQTNDLSLSPVSVAYAELFGLPDPYVHPSLQQIFSFVNFYQFYYQAGEGKDHPDAERRWKNAARVRYNVETKINPRTDMDNRGDVFADRTVGPEEFAAAVARTIIINGLADRADIQSFDFRTLLEVHENFPVIRTVFLFGDFPKFDSPDAPMGFAGDGTNMQDQDGENTPWMAGLFWPYRSTAFDNPFRARSSGGFEGMALTTDGETLLPLLERPLVDDTSRVLLIHEFDLATSSYNGTRYEYPLDERAGAIGDFIMFSETHGLIIERDGTQGDLEGFKQVFEVCIKENGNVTKELNVDLISISDPLLISTPGRDGDVGLGRTFAFPFVTIESVVVLDPYTIGILNDNNYPFSRGRNPILPDDNEFILIYLEEPLDMGEESEEVAEVMEDSEGLTNYPNPFSTSTEIAYTIPEGGMVELTIVDGFGNVVKAFTKEHAEAGTYTYTWNTGKSIIRGNTNIGTYFVTVKAGELVMNRRLLKIR